MNQRDLANIERLERRLRELEAASRRRGIALIVMPLAFAALAASAPSKGFGAIESRLLALESLIRMGPDGSAQTQVPFQVLDRSGRLPSARAP